MEPARFYRESRVLLVAGKGGVGKTVVAATLAMAAARHGEDVVLASVGDPIGLPGCFGSAEPLTADERELARFGTGAVRGRLLSPDAILLEYLGGHGFGRVARRLGAAGVLQVVTSAVPGIEEVLVLGKLKQLERANAASLFVLELPASGHATRFLTSAAGLADLAKAGPLRSQAEEAAALVTDPERCALVLVTILEETPVNELVETAFAVEDETGVRLGPIIVNDCLRQLPHLDEDPARAAADAGLAVDADVLDRVGAAGCFRRARQQHQDEQLARLADKLPLPQIRLPHLRVPELDEGALGELADALDDGLATLAS
jgi:anion-transporting  ArsA/GET3 family ATPase